MKALRSIAFAASVCACASINRAAEYQASFADAKNFSTAFEIEISVHPRDNMLLLNPRVDFGDPFVVASSPGEHIMRSVATEFFGQTGCVVTDVRRMGDPWFEASFQCPSDFDFRSAIAAQRRQLRSGDPLTR
jgi:hypothetical protein